MELVHPDSSATATAHELLRLSLADARAPTAVASTARLSAGTPGCASTPVTLEPATAPTAIAAAAALPGSFGRNAAVLLAGITAAHDLADGGTRVVADIPVPATS